MNFKKLAFILSISTVLPSICFAQAANLDEVYRQIIKANNQDYLPMFVKNRQEPDFLKDIETIEGLASPNDSVIDLNQVVDFENKKEKAYQEKRAQELKWQGVILAVQQNKVTPYDIEEIEKKVATNDPQAVEIYAFMNAKGIGLYQDLTKAFLLYQKALNLGVNNAKENAILVFNSMSKEEKRQLKAMTHKP